MSHVEITEQKRLEAELVHRAMHDELTGLANRALLIDRLHQLLRRQDRTGGSSALLLIDLDHFKVVNDGMGHEAGDQLLVAVSRRLQRVVRPEDTVARLGGDEFVVLCETVGDATTALRIAQRVQAAVHQPITIASTEMTPAASVGVAILGVSSADPQALLRDADAALYRAKALGRHRVELFDEELRTRAMNRLEAEGQLRRALERDELELVFQPIFSLTDRSVRAVEALVRWQHPDRGELRAEEFIGLAEETGLVVPLGRWVLRTALTVAAEWPASGGLEAPAVAVNVSARQLLHPSLPEHLNEALAGAALPPERVWLEIVESLLIEQEARAVLDDLRSIGVRIAVDDFGTGFSSLGYLTRLPIDVLKVDKSFVRGSVAAAADVAVVRAVVGLGRTLGLITVAEGIETEEQLDALTEIGCDAGQGHVLRAPLRADVLAQLLDPSGG